MSSSRHKKYCPFCQGIMLTEERRCRHCGAYGNQRKMFHEDYSVPHKGMIARNPWLEYPLDYYERFQEYLMEKLIMDQNGFHYDCTTHSWIWQQDEFWLRLPRRRGYIFSDQFQEFYLPYRLRTPQITYFEG